MQIKFDNVNYVYQPGSISETSALHDIDLTIAPGELVAVIGHGGSGKSTLSLLMAGLYQPTSGQVLIGNGKPDEHLFRSVGLVFQYPEQQLFGETVFQEVAFGAKNFGVPVDYLSSKVRKALDMVGLDADLVWDRSPFSLSGGQKRRVCIAGVLATSPQVLILDEPTAGLDESGRRWMMNLAQQLHEEGRTVVWVTHNMTEAAELAERIIVLNQGRIVLDGPPKDVFAQEKVLHTAHLEIPQAARLVRKLKNRGLSLAGEAVTVPEAYAEISSFLQKRSNRKDNKNGISGIDFFSAADVVGFDYKVKQRKNSSMRASEEDVLWEQKTAAELRSLVKETVPEKPENQLSSVYNENTVDFDLSDLDEGSPAVPAWKDGADDV